MRISDGSSDVCSSDLPPGALARDHPIGPPLDHRTDAVLRPRGHPLRPLDRIECCFAEGRAIARPLTQRHPSEGWDLKRPLPRAIAQDPSLRWGDSGRARAVHRSEEPTSELQALNRTSYALVCSQKKT